ncbi:cytochrome c1 heme lyase, putative [Theileria equi strain WA]|uniref:Holocytochrome c-type synthase n=1 Tax=Theileria equi strain WA TaxID=1537102 RepID=L1LFJ3_THEEQ|nr:cytochrome c1 heme lyase, putative [Theileria equi strain WA]EKX74025.1 cytochrome c1 heme lyase, putative [Theileria equi strain WA]|eukprot:XP_004833477.1 cytochrome c1 heme lyase, putative [Theileria equi strain WA]
MTCPADSGSSCSPPTGKSVNSPPEHILSQLNDRRTKSSIPSRESLWLYPSQRQFYKSTLNKGYDVDANLIPAMVDIHNVINERAWEQVMEYESLHAKECENPLLIRFVGKKDQYTIRSMINYIRGYKLPYDRHDWTVDRCGKSIRYIIDFYEGESKEKDKFGVYIDARPELTFSGICDRLRLFFNKSISR